MVETSAQKKAVVVGGSNGIGLALTRQLVQKNYFVYVLDIVVPCDLEKNELLQIKYIYCNLLDFDEALFQKLSECTLIDTLIITAGAGSVAEFQNMHIAQIENTLKLNTLATIKVFSIFYKRIQAKKDFFSLVLGSIAGEISSPLFSIYAASKAAVNRFVESINIELECSGYENRVLNVSPGTIKGTKFYGGENHLAELDSLVSEILYCMMQKEVLYIPDYEPVYKDVINRYRENPHEFGVSSYQYKQSSGRMNLYRSAKIGYLSGTFDLFHIGHLNLIKRAKECCDYLIVGVHPNAAHKGKDTFISFEERKAIVGAIQYVDKVVDSFPEDSDAWNALQYNMLFVGSDYKGTERFNRYETFFAEKDVEIVYLPYTQNVSSTKIREELNVKGIIS